MARTVREIPWDRMVRFHKEICRRSEETFFSLAAGDANSDRWSSLENFAPENLAGPWEIPYDGLVSDELYKRLRAEEAIDLFLGGPCWISWNKDGRNWYVEGWRPALYREVRCELVGETISITPLAGNWDISPLVFELLEKRQVATSVPLEESMAAILENVQRLQTEQGSPALQAIAETLAAYSTELGEELRKAAFEFPVHLVETQPTHWVLFGPNRGNNVSAYAQHIIKDYNRLEERLSINILDLGGLALLADDPKVEPFSAVDVLPIVPLNDSQLKAVDTVFMGRPVTVISGPPGCGKSQVVLSLLLNAWSQGISTLFASNNNQAVDVVRQRLETFENDIPVAVRAGAKRFSNIEDSLRRSLNLIASMASSTGKQELAKLKRKQKQLIERRDSKRVFLDSELPDRVDQAVRSAISAYATFQEINIKNAAFRSDLEAKLHLLGYRAKPESFAASVVEPAKSWISDMSHWQELAENDQRMSQDLIEKICKLRQTRDTCCALIGLDISTQSSLTWIRSADTSPERLEATWNQIKELIYSPIDAEMEPVTWQKGYDIWKDALEATRWAESAESLIDDIRELEEATSAQLKLLAELQSKFQIATSELEATFETSQLPEGLAAVRKWHETYAQYCSIPSGNWDWLPWNNKNKIKQELASQEAVLRRVLPIVVWKKLGPIDDATRVQLSDQLSVAIKWYVDGAALHAMNDFKADVTARGDDFRKRARSLRFKLEQLPEPLDVKSWIKVAVDIERTVAVAKAASIAWSQRVKRESTMQQIRDLKQELMMIGVGTPIREAWVSSNGRPLANDLEKFVSEFTPDSLAKLRANAYEDRVERLVAAWRQVIDCEVQARDMEIQAEKILPIQLRVKSWMRLRPKALLSQLEVQTEFPPPDSALFAHLGECQAWVNAWDEYSQGPGKELAERANKEYLHAVGILREGHESIPTDLQPKSFNEYIDSLDRESDHEWNIEKIRETFDKFQPSIIRSEIEGIEAELQSVSFQLAKLDWQHRVADDPELQDALRDLRTHYQRNRGDIRVDGEELFKKVLRAQPVWIVTALAGQSIPLLPGLFDLVVIDEATQCTLTNLLPLIYRCKRLVVIGDPEQLPAIASLGMNAERAMAEKYGVADWLNLLGHADNDLYKCAVSCLPRRQGDVVTLVEHYRSHPLIIGFSNQYIYRKSLKLRKDPNQSKEVPMGSGVVGVNVSGRCERIDGSWANPPESNAVVELVSSIRRDPAGANLTIGVVTPFRGQKNTIQKALDSNGLAKEVTVDTVHGYQGDERDVMIFSPTVARGMNSSAAKWVETPKNLINVAITRAREALYFVADFDECRKQQGVLGQFARYVETVDLLRKTSFEEMQLFGWILMQGMMPEVHKRINGIEVDFILERSGIRLAVEVDGDQHLATTAQDQARDASLVGAGYKVLRVKARDVRDAPAVVLARIGKQLEAREEEWDYEAESA